MKHVDQGEMKHVDLKPGGGDLPVTYDTRKEYVAWAMPEERRG